VDDNARVYTTDLFEQKLAKEAKDLNCISFDRINRIDGIGSPALGSLPILFILLILSRNVVLSGLSVLLFK
jgi:hypothetical protein